MPTVSARVYDRFARGIKNLQSILTLNAKVRAADVDSACARWRCIREQGGERALKVVYLTLLICSVVSAQAPQATKKPPSSIPKPDLANFETYDAYTDALIRWTIADAVAESPLASKFATLEIGQLKARISELQKQLTDLSGKFATFQEDTRDELRRANRSYAALDPSNPDAYARVDTDAGPLLVSIVKIEPYLSGHIARINIGNPSSITFKGFKVSASHAPSRKPDETASVWIKKWKFKDFSFTQSLAPSRWTPIDHIFPETASDQFGQVHISIDVNVVAMTP